MLQFTRQHAKNKTNFFNKWTSKWCLDTHLAKSLVLIELEFRNCFDKEGKQQQEMRITLNLHNNICFWPQEFSLGLKRMKNIINSMFSKLFICTVSSFSVVFDILLCVSKYLYYFKKELMLKRQETGCPKWPFSACTQNLFFEGRKEKTMGCKGWNVLE